MTGAEAFQEAAPAKVNLFLHVTGRRTDGYHLLDSLAVFPGPGDVLHAEPATELSLEIVGPFAAGLSAGPDNLVLRAARALAPGRGARLVLEKNLPVASGIGGGSADAAAALRLLGRLWDVPVDGNVAVALGADVPVCLQSTACRMGGIGDVLTKAPILPACAMLLVNPGVAVSTAEIFRQRTGPDRTVAQLPDHWTDPAKLAGDLSLLHNDLEPIAIELCPPIALALDWLRSLPGCLLARMSGSGATCFGLFAGSSPMPKPPQDWWLGAGTLGRPLERERVGDVLAGARIDHVEPDALCRPGLQKLDRDITSGSRVI